MSITTEFNASAKNSSSDKKKRKRPAPFSLRLSDTERAQLLEEAKGVPLSAYIKAKIFSSKPLRLRKSGRNIEDHKSFARALGLLGKAELASNLAQIAHAVNIGVLPVTPETEAELFNSISDVREIRCLLIQALGLQESDQ